MDRGTEVRRVRHGWAAGPQGWTYSDISQDLWEVLCRACGDDEGPAERQPPAARRLRRPAIGQAAAIAVMDRHLLEQHSDEPIRTGSARER